VTTELYWLTLTALMTALFWVPYVLNRMVVSGLGGTLSGTSPTSEGHSAWANRAIKAHTNAIENLAIFAPIVLGILWPFWGVLLAPPLLAVVYAYKARYGRREL